MGGQFEALLVEVAGKLQGVERILSTLQEGQKDLQRDMGNLRIRVAQIEQDRKWMGEERRMVHGRLETGDGKFQTLQRDVGEALRISKSLRDQLQERKTSQRKKIAWKLLEVGAPLLMALLLQVLYHLLMIGPQIAQAIKKAGVGP